MRVYAAIVISISVLASAAQGQTIRIVRSGAEPSRSAPPDNFTGSARIDSSFQGTAPARVYGARVTFEPGARTAWHAHVLGQTLIVTGGTGRVQRWGDPVQEIRQGDIVWIPPGQKHWHGATPKSGMTHIAVVEQLDGKSTEWMEHVTEAQYGASVTNQARANSNEQTTAAQKIMGDIAPKLTDLTDKVLFGDVWERPELSQRDRSLVTVAALIAMNRPDQLRSHMARARANGLTQDELVEAITHLAFYSGWPNAVTAVGVARDVFKESK